MASGSLIALVRPPTAALARCELTHIERVPIDVRKAIAQHAAYGVLLQQLGATVIGLGPEPSLPDAVFVEDIAVVLDDVALITNPGAASRVPECESVAAALSPYRELCRMTEPGTLDGGDVIVADSTIYAGLSSRSNEAGVRQLAALAEPRGYTVKTVRVEGCLHLKSACTYAGGGIFVVDPQCIDADVLDAAALVLVPAAEPGAANTFRVGDTVVMAAGAPRTRRLLEAHGLPVSTIDLSELRKAEAAGSCMSLIFRA